MSSGFIPPHGGFENLHSYKKALIIFLATYYLAKKWVRLGSRTRDQMEQSARSGKQNIVEGSLASATSKQTEIHLTNVARASLGELHEDYKDFLRLRMTGIVATDRTGAKWAFDVAGAFTSNRVGLRRAETLWKSLGKAAVLHEGVGEVPLVLLTTDIPGKTTAGHQALSVMRGPTRPVFDVVELLNIDDQARLHGYATHGRPG